MLILTKREKPGFALVGCTKAAVACMKAAMDQDLDIVAVSDESYPEMRNLLDACGLIGCDPSTGGLIGCVYTFTDYRAMIREKKPDLVAIAADSENYEEIKAFCESHGARVIETDKAVSQK